MKRSKQRPRLAGPHADVSGTIVPDALYRIDEIAARMGWGDHALRAARRRGLKVLKSGKRCYVIGSDLLDFVRKGGSDAN
jgi:hypothetical protein